MFLLLLSWIIFLLVGVLSGMWIEKRIPRWQLCIDEYLKDA